MVTPGGSCPDAAAALDAHNAYRARHRAPPLSWNSELAESSEAWALDLASKQGCRTVHSTDYTFGENLYAMKRFPKPIDGSCKTVVGDWYNEVLSFNFSTPRLFADNAGKGMGHFTQLVWRATTSVGCGTALVDFPVAFPSGTVRTGGCKVVVCRYLPPGNMPTESAFALNVLPPVRV
ncbi:hypothetical protein PLESTB_000687300 [Pleodorina starrii]|uniref:SCP domain-containing protein n=1 Tax=Pleodorina starrii TaxID=330485 RepID=A0A9W6BK59_9CHLO|nr:hypothetical protein PLESTB_000687300 [Pleodorina starrii]